MPKPTLEKISPRRKSRPQKKEKLSTGKKAALTNVSLGIQGRESNYGWYQYGEEKANKKST